MIEISGRHICENCFEETECGPCAHCGYDPAESAKDPTLLAPGTVLLEKYIIGKVLGKGGFGVTYLTYDKAAENKVVVKEYFPYGIARRSADNTTVVSSSADNADIFEDGAEKFYNEAKFISKFNGHPNIVNIYEFFYENNTVYYSMEYLSGQTLKEYIRDHGTIRAPQALYIARRVADALEVAHSESVLHRDISPDNIVICNNGNVKLIDFGSARQVIDERSQSFSVIVKPGFAPLEQYQKKSNQGPWTDIFSLGTTLYFALTGDIPEDPISRFDEDDTFKSNLFDIDPELWDIISKAAKLKIEDRYASAAELNEALKRVSFKPQRLVAYPNGTASRKRENTYSKTDAGSKNYKRHIVFSSQTDMKGFFDKHLRTVTDYKAKVHYLTVEEECKPLFEMLYSGMENGQSEIPFKEQGYEYGAVKAVYNKMLYDNPHLCYAQDFSAVYHDDNKLINGVRLNYCEKDHLKMINRILDIISYVNEDDSMIDKLVIIHDYLVNNTQISERLAHDACASAYGAVVNQNADDIGFAKAFCYLAQALGFSCYVIDGQYKGELRAWCRVKLEDTWFNVDCYGDKLAGNVVTKMKVEESDTCFKTYFLTNDHHIQANGYAPNPEYRYLCEGEYAAAYRKDNYFFQRNKHYYFFIGPDSAYSIILERSVDSFKKHNPSTAYFVAPFVVDRLYDKMNSQYLSDIEEQYGMKFSGFTMDYFPNEFIVTLIK